VDDDYGQYDRDYWNTKYAEASCHTHGEWAMLYDEDSEEWVCQECEEIGLIYKYG
jgi:hypothetical protein